MSKILLEKKLTTDFTFGFELEMNVWGEFDYYNDGTYDESAPIAQFFKKYMGEDGIFKYDGSIEEDDGCARYVGDDDYKYEDVYYSYEELTEQGLEDNIETPVEYNSPVLKFNPSNIQKTINMLDDGLDNLFSVNGSCGFHHHLSFPNIQPEDVAWIVCNLAMDDKAKEMFKQFKKTTETGEERTYDFVTSYSDDNYLNRLKNAIEEMDFKQIIKELNTEKYSLVNVHGNNTIEWRGPRNFLNDGGRQTLIQFYSQLWRIVNWMTNVLDKKEINGISKENFLKGMIIGNNRQPLEKYHPFTISGKFLDDETLEELVKKIDNNDFGVIYSLLNQPIHLEQLIQRLFNKSKLTGAVRRMMAFEAELPQKFYDLCYKYIPSVLSDRASIEALEKTSVRTLRRLFKYPPSLLNFQVSQSFDIVIDKVSDDVLGQVIYEDGAEVIDAILTQTGYKYISKIFRTAPKDMRVLIFNKFIFKITRDNLDFETKSDLVSKIFDTMPLEDRQKIIQNITQNISQLPFFIRYIDTLDNRSLISIIGYSQYLGTYDKVKSVLLQSGKVSPKLLEELEKYFTKYYQHNWDIDDFELIP